MIFGKMPAFLFISKLSKEDLQKEDLQSCYHCLRLAISHVIADSVQTDNC